MDDAQRQRLEQREVLRVAGQFGVLRKRQQADGIAAELDLVAFVHEERGLRTRRQSRVVDEVADQVSERLVDRHLVPRIARELPAFQQRIGGAGMPQGVVGGNGAVEAREPAVLVLARRRDLPREIVGARGDYFLNVRLVPAG
ncbi:hypothetical protein FQZ97_723850 [compost metagenome]